MKKYAAKNDKARIAFKKAKSSLEKVMAMIEADKYCIDIIQQNLAVIGLLKAANMRLLEGHIDCCVKSACLSGKKKDVEEKMAELLHVMNLAQSK